ncbi:hypothetical protein DFH09DRAFT_1444340 [Mycena vulgaris]|nr:hypothetical protein DFH09DRAFT_1444340 [Mycena vulgaris]
MGFYSGLVESTPSIAAILTIFHWVKLSGGLGFSATEIGYTLSMSSAFFAFFQLLLMPILMRKFSIVRMYMFCVGVWPLTFMLVPLLNAIVRMGQINPGADSYVNFDVLLWISIAVVIICWRVACLAYSNNAILVRNNCPSPSSLGSANGLNVLSISVSRCTSPAFVSTLFALSVDKHLLGGHLWDHYHTNPPAQKLKELPSRILKSSCPTSDVRVTRIHAPVVLDVESLAGRAPHAPRALWLPLQLSNVLPPTSHTLRKRRGFAHSLSFAPAFPNITATGPIGPTAGNLLRRKHSSVVVSLDLLPPSVDFGESRTEYFA